MILTEDDLQQVLRRRALQRERRLPREGQQIGWDMDDAICIFMAVTIIPGMALLCWWGLG